jgi:hypothetical protein
MHQAAENYDRLGLPERRRAVETYTHDTLLMLNALAQALNHADAIQSWVVSNDPTKMRRVADLRTCREAASEYLKMGQSMLDKLDVPELTLAINRLPPIVEVAREREKTFKERAEALWEREVTAESTEDMLIEAQDLEQAFQGCDRDLEDLRTGRRALNIYKTAHDKLCDETLSLEMLNSEYAQLCSAAEASLNDDDPPWLPSDVMPRLLQAAMAHRHSLGTQWLLLMEREVNGLDGSDVASAGNVHTRLEREPAYLSGEQRTAASALRTQVGEMMGKAKVKWLLEEFQKLEPGLQQEFVALVSGKEQPKKRGWFS